MSTLFRKALLTGGVFTVAFVTLFACDNLNQTSDIPDPDAAPEFDAGFVPTQTLDDSGVGTPANPDAGQTPSGRVRLANLLVGSPPLDMCVRAGNTGPFDAQKISATGQVPKPEGLAYGEVSTHFFVPVNSPKGQSYSLRIVALGQPCDGTGAAPIADVSPAPTIQQGGGVTVGIVGRFGVDAGDAIPKATAAADIVNVPSTFAELRVFHGIPDMPAFDVTVDGDNVLPGVRYGSVLFYPYTTTSGFAQLAAGVNQGATLGLQVGTKLQLFTVPDRIRRGIAMTIFASGSYANPSLALCSDRTPPNNQNRADCTTLAPKTK